MKNKKNDARLEEAKRRMFNFLKTKTYKQRNRFFKGIADFEAEKIDSCILKYSEPGVDLRRTWFRDRHEAVKYYEQQKEELPTLIFNETKKGDEYFDQKLNFMVRKLEGFGFLEDGWQISNSNFSVSEGLGLNFWIEVAKHTGKISNGTFERQEQRVYGRLVWVQCFDKISHYRFIVTNKKTDHYKQTA